MEIELTETPIDINLQGSIQIQNDHSELDNLDYANSGHTGFASSTDLQNKVDKVEGKSLSTNDYTTAEKNKLAGIDMSTKQDTLTAGENITIVNNVISSTGGGSSDYLQLSNKPKINNVELNGNKSLTDLGINIPTKTSDITNDSGYITNSVNDLTNYTKTSDLGSLATKSSVNYETEVTNKPTIPDINTKEDIFRYSTMPTASVSNVGKIVEYIGTTDSNYTNGYFYQCVDTSVQESITATQTDNVVPLGTITLNNSEFKSQASAGTHEFYYRPYNTVLNFTNISVFPPVSYQVTRDNTFDIQPMIPNAPKLYSWVDGSNNFYVTDTLNPNALTKLYLLDIQTNDLTDTNATFISSNTPSQLEGRWTKKEGDVYTDIELSDYGIYLTSSGLPGNTIQVTYVEANTSYSWQQKNVQPTASGATWGSITGTLSNQTDLNTALGSKQDTLTAGTGISIVNNVISVNLPNANGQSF